MEMRMGLLRSMETFNTRVYEGKPLLSHRGDSLPPPPDKPKTPPPSPKRTYIEGQLEVRKTATGKLRQQLKVEIADQARVMLADGVAMYAVSQRLGCSYNQIRNIQLKMIDEGHVFVPVVKPPKPPGPPKRNYVLGRAPQAIEMLAAGTPPAEVADVLGISERNAYLLKQKMAAIDCREEPPPPPPPKFVSTGEGVRCHVLDWDKKISTWTFDGPAWPKCKPRPKRHSTSARGNGVPWRQNHLYQRTEINSKPRPRNNPFE